MMREVAYSKGHTRNMVPEIVCAPSTGERKLDNRSVQGGELYQRFDQVDTFYSVHKKTGLANRHLSINKITQGRGNIALELIDHWASIIFYKVTD